MFIGFAPNDVPAGSNGNGFPFQGTAEISDDGELIHVSALQTYSGSENPLTAILERN